MATEVVIPPHVEAELGGIGDHIAKNDRQAALRVMQRLQRLQRRCRRLPGFHLSVAGSVTPTGSLFQADT